MVEEAVSCFEYDLLTIGDLDASLRNTQNTGGAAIARTYCNLVRARRSLDRERLRPHCCMVHAIESNNWASEKS